MSNQGHAQEGESFRPESKTAPDETFRAFLKDQFAPGSGQDATAYSKLIHDMTNSDAAQKLVNDLFGDPGKLLDHHHGNKNAEAMVAEKLVEMALPRPKDSAERQADIQQADSAAGDANNTVVVSDGDLGRLLAARGSLGGSAAEQYAQARIDAAISMVQGKLSAQTRNNELGGPLSAGEAQQAMNASQINYRFENQKQAS
jgi:hypothetical protein